MSTNDMRLEVEQNQSLQEYRQLRREKQHLLQKEMERGLSEWEKERLHEIPAELKEVETLLGAITTAAIQKAPSTGIAKKRESGVTMMLAVPRADLPKLPKAYVLG